MTSRIIAFAAVLAFSTVVLGSPAGAQPPYTPSSGCAQAGGSGAACTEVAGVTVTNSSDSLALTGTDTGTIAVAGATLVGAGAAFVVISRRRREAPEPIRF